MSRKLLIDIHLYLATFFTPILLMFAISGGLYLLGYKGETTHGVIHQGQAQQIDMQAEDIESELRRFFNSQQIDADFEYVKGRGNRYFTRPTSTDYYVVEVKDEQVSVTLHQPDLTKILVELHKGHGPGAFRTLEKISAVGLIVILISGLWLGLTARSMKNRTIVLTSAGLVTFFLFGIL